MDSKLERSYNHSEPSDHALHSLWICVHYRVILEFILHFTRSVRWIVKQIMRKHKEEGIHDCPLILVVKNQMLVI
jgi:hypothetical protein